MAKNDASATSVPILNFDMCRSTQIQTNSLSVRFSHKLSIKLTESNFLLWTQQVEGVIIVNQLHRFVVNPKIPARFASEAYHTCNRESDEYQQWLVQDQSLFIWLLSSLSESILPRTIGCKHSFQVWDKIHKHFQSIMKARVRQLRTELKTTKIGDKLITEYILRIKAIVDALLLIGDPISEQEHTDAILEGLPVEFNPFVLGYYGRSDVVSISDLEALLLVQEVQIDKFNQDLSSISMTANVAHRGGNFSQSHRDCRNGYRGRGNRGRGRSNGGRSGGQKPTCQLCLKYGHDAFQCWYRFDETLPPLTPMVPSNVIPLNQQPPVPTGSTESSPANSPNALVATHQLAHATQEFKGYRDFDDDLWYADSGASHHVTASAQNLSQNQAYKGSDMIHMGNGQGLHIISTGYSHFRSPFVPSVKLSLNNVLHVPI